MRQLVAGAGDNILGAVALLVGVAALAKAAAIGAKGNVAALCQLQAVIVVKKVDALGNDIRRSVARHAVFARALVAGRAQKHAVGRRFLGRYQDIHRHIDVRLGLQQNFFPHNAARQVYTLQQLGLQVARLHAVHAQKVAQAGAGFGAPEGKVRQCCAREPVFSRQFVVFFLHGGQCGVVCFNFQCLFHRCTSYLL